jgi:hypothetical protein
LLRGAKAQAHALCRIDSSNGGASSSTKPLYVADPFSAIEQSVRGAAGGNDPAPLRDMAVSALRGLLIGNQQEADEAHRASLVLLCSLLSSLFYCSGQ